jgi:uncharacterized protein (TIGR03083 family)
MSSGVLSGLPFRQHPNGRNDTLRDLVEHVGQTRYWVAAIVEDRVADPSRLPTTSVPLPDAPDAWPSWLADGASRLAAAAVDAGPDVPVWNPSGGSRSGTQFRIRRIVAEAVIHRADAAATSAVFYDLAAEITDHLAMITSPGWTAQVPASAAAMRGTGQTMCPDADDAGQWIVSRNPDGATWQHGRGPADVTVSGPAPALLLARTRRSPGDDLQFSGDHDLFTHWVDNTARRAG